MSAWYEIIVTGTEDALHGFVAGREAALGGAETAIYGSDVDLEGGRFSQRLRDLFAAGSHHVLLAPARLAERLVGALKRSGGDAGLGVESVQEVTRARISFSAEVFSREIAGRIRQSLLGGPPPGVRGEDIEEHEEHDPEAHGAELYTPEHEYTYTVSGAFSGPLPGVLEMQRRTRELPFLKVKPLELETTPAELPGNDGE
jgi:hypothetical protein